MTGPLDDHSVAEQLAAEAGRLLVDVRRKGRTRGLDPAELGRSGDRTSDELLHRRLAELCPDDAVLSEESADDGRRLSVDRVWIVDPLDGTREFSMPDRSDWAVHVALWDRASAAHGPGIRAAAVALPALSLVLTTAHPPVRADRAVTGGSSDTIRLVVSASRPPAFLRHLRDHLPVEIVPMGSAGAKAMAVVRGEADAYLHAGGQYEWDSAAPVGVVMASGLHASRLDGSPLHYNQPDVFLPDLLICRPELTRPLLDALSAVGCA